MPQRELAQNFWLFLTPFENICTRHPFTLAYHSETASATAAGLPIETV